MKKYILCGLLVLGLTITAYCGQQSKIELNDGSIVEAEVLSLDNGVYSVNSAGLGALKIDSSKVRSIRTENMNPPASLSSPQQSIDQTTAPSQEEMKSELERVKTKITNDPDTMKSVNGLLLDPQFQELLKDPAVVNAAKNQDFKALMQNQKFLNIINNQKIQEIEKKVQGQGN